MSRKKAPFKSYEGIKQNDKHIRITDSMMMSKPYLALSSNAKVLYSYMKLWACGREEFEYPTSLALKLMSNKTFIKAKEELIDYGFIETLNDGRFNKTKNIYKFTSNWISIELGNKR